MGRLRFDFSESFLRLKETEPEGGVCTELNTSCGNKIFFLPS